MPDANTVFLCRPTASDILFAQMIGRAARRTPTKSTFHVVEFTDNCKQHGELFKTAQAFFDGAGGAWDAERPDAGRQPPASPVPQRSSSRHAFDINGAPAWIVPRDGLPQALHGLWYRVGQSFGIEFELTTREGPVPWMGARWLETANALRDALSGALGRERVAPRVLETYEGSEGTKDTSVWNVEYDASVGWEVTTPVLSGLSGFEEVDRACAALEPAAKQLGLWLNHRTGTHVHLGWMGRDVRDVLRAIELAKLFEPALATLVGPSRVVQAIEGGYRRQVPNEYCRPVSEVFSRSVMRRLQTLEDVLEVADGDEARRVTFNVKPLQHIHTVEVRMHSGTLEAAKILQWVSLWQQLLWAASHKERPIPEVPDVPVLEPSGDIVELAKVWLPDATLPQQQVLLRRLAARRREIASVWAKYPELQGWLEHANRWQDPEGVGEQVGGGVA